MSQWWLLNIVQGSDIYIFSATLPRLPARCPHHVHENHVPPLSLSKSLTGFENAEFWPVFPSGMDLLVDAWPGLCRERKVSLYAVQYLDLFCDSREYSTVATA